MDGIVNTLRKAIVWWKQSEEFTQFEYDQYRYAHRDRRIQEDMQEQEDGESFMAEMRSYGLTDDDGYGGEGQ
jgi:hypothetical protein